MPELAADYGAPLRQRGLPDSPSLRGRLTLESGESLAQPFHEATSRRQRDAERLIWEVPVRCRVSLASAPSDAREVRLLSHTVTDDELAGLVQRVTEAAQALISGDIHGYAARIKHAHDYTLMSPKGGDPVRGFDDSDGALDALAQFFHGGEAQVEVVETYTSSDLAVLVVVERQHGTIGDLPEQDWSLRVTWVFRRTAESEWELVHRHADALVHPIDHDRLGALARGE